MSFIQKIFFRVVTNAIRASTGMFSGKSILLPEKLCFLLEIWICSSFFCSVANKLSRWAKTAMHVFMGNICGNFTLKNCFFSIVRTLSRETRTFSGKKWHVCQNCSKNVRPKKFPEKCFWIADLSSILNVDQEDFGIYRKK